MLGYRKRLFAQPGEKQSPSHLVSAQSGEVIPVYRAIGASERDGEGDGWGALVYVLGVRLALGDGGVSRVQCSSLQQAGDRASSPALILTHGCFNTYSLCLLA